MHKRSVVFAVGLIILAALGRLLPHPPNFVPFMSIGLFGVATLKPKSLSLVIPLLALLLSDYFIGFYPGMAWVYGGVFMSSLFGFFLTRSFRWVKLAGCSISASFVFFLVSNFGVWLGGTLYTQNATGLVECYLAAIPFYRNSLLSDLVYSGVLFGVYRFVTYRFFVKTGSTSHA